MKKPFEGTTDSKKKEKRDSKLEPGKLADLSIYLTYEEQSQKGRRPAMPPFSFDEMKQMRELMKDAGIRNAVVVYRRGLRAEAERKHLLAVAAQENEDTLKKTRESLDRRPLSELDQLVIVYGHLKGLARVQRDPARFTLPILPSDMSEDEYQRLRARLEDPEVLAVVKQELAKRAKI